ncbi:alanine dehydrogenase [Marinobacter psychrophilus]|uniref:alanine dehydrogenase n=1 Tax=Marinobacter psychrophilus TaxID=330734 RepID=UPI001B6C6B58|nr:alanine dehydrogenase [Marinobacter psychrophilus]MBQ0761810.1 alanine dehydrogenase [Marinobacter psychrophilus]MBQ0846468.1 alanine dehydrogenase [Marinobacter psychrophilus]
MIIGIPKEIKNNEFRVGLGPEAVQELVAHGHQVVVQASAGAGIDFTDEQYLAAGASLVVSAEEVFKQAELIVKVKEPQASERALLRPHHTLFTYLHLAPDVAQTKELLESGATCIAYETVTDGKGGLPLLAPMSEVAGRMSIQAGARCLEKSQNGRGMLLGGVPGVQAAMVAIIGGGVVGFAATQMAVGMGARVVVLDKSMEVLRRFDAIFGNRVQTLFSCAKTIEDTVLQADVVIGGVLIPGAAAPKLVTRELISRMKPGSVVVDVAIDQGGCFETSKPTTHADPTYVVDGVVHYCVANMPGAVARTSTYALNNATLPYVLQIADKGPRKALEDNEHLLNGLNVVKGQLTCPSVGVAQGIESISPTQGLTLID